MPYVTSRWAAAGVLLTVIFASPALAQQCGGNFNQWLTGVRQEAAAQGISEGATAALDGVRQDKSVIKRDRAQGVFAQTFLQFSDRMVAQYRLSQGANQLRKHAKTFARIEKQYGVPGPVITAFWGLETDFGANQGEFSTLNALATLGHDCRRPQLFRPQLIDALKLIDRGDLPANRLIGAWAGELGQTQMLPSDYLESGVDYDGDGRVDLIRSTPDVLATTGNFLRNLGWRAGQPWVQEVRVPADLPWEQSSLTTKHPRSQWAHWGVTAASGKPIKADGLPASLILPMGRNGPAFLAYPNFDVYLKWNKSLVYSTTAAYFATRLAGAGPVRRADVRALGVKEVQALQKVLVKRGYDVGKVDGVLGAATRDAVRAEQVRLGLPADSWPTADLVARLRAGE